ncbi:MAG: hypothetical protein ACRDLT_12625 [Solirubrobacteraceae bacterium]
MFGAQLVLQALGGEPLVEAHGGTVSARSIPEQETVFSVRLPNSIRPGAPVAGTALPADPA